METTAVSFITALVVVASASEDVEVSCDLWETCVLPCAFTPGDDPVIHWTKEPGEIPVHIHYYGQHQLQDQHESYRNRTSLSGQGIRTGDASLQLHKVNVRDEGSYKCYVSTFSSKTITDSYVNLRVNDSTNTKPTPAPKSTTTTAPPLAPDKSHQYLWILLLIPIAVIALVRLFVCCRKVVQTERLYCSVPPGDSSTQQNGHQNGLNKAPHRANGLPNGECETEV